MRVSTRALFSFLGSIPARFVGRGGTPAAVKVRRAIKVSLTRPPSPHAIHRALRRFTGESDIRVSGLYGKIRGSIHDRTILEKYAQTKSWCPVENKFFVDYFVQRGGGTYLDIGANIGLTTIPVARNPSVTCLAFEPEPSNFQYLQANIATNCRRGNVEVLSLALFDKPGRLEFQLSPSNMGDHRVRVGKQDGAFGEGRWPAIRVDAERLDDVMAGRTIAEPLAAKVIAQGAEAHIIAGGRNVLARAEIMVVEFFPYALERLRADIGFLTRFLSENFRLAAILPGGQPTPPSWSPAAAVIGEMQRLMLPGAATPHDYFHVFLSK